MSTDEIMSLAQEYASAWSLVGSRFDNGDCARMEAALGIDMRWGENHVIASRADLSDCELEYFSDHAGDKNAARRAASVAVAAEIGRAM